MIKRKRGEKDMIQKKNGQTQKHDKEKKRKGRHMRKKHQKEIIDKGIMERCETQKHDGEKYIGTHMRDKEKVRIDKKTKH